MKKSKKEITEKQFFEYLMDKRITLSCGHKFQIHNFSNTLIVTNDGKTKCHSCGY